MGGKQKKRIVWAFQNKKCPSVGTSPPPPQTREKKMHSVRCPLIILKKHESRSLCVG